MISEVLFAKSALKKLVTNLKLLRWMESVFLCFEEEFVCMCSDILVHVDTACSLSDVILGSDNV